MRFSCERVTLLSILALWIGVHIALYLTKPSSKKRTLLTSLCLYTRFSTSSLPYYGTLHLIVSTHIVFRTSFIFGIYQVLFIDTGVDLHIRLEILFISAIVIAVFAP
jgi:hypothetical protein